jgi:hypothetical protein
MFAHKVIYNANKGTPNVWMFDRTVHKVFNNQNSINESFNFQLFFTETDIHCTSFNGLNKSSDKMRF